MNRLLGSIGALPVTALVALLVTVGSFAHAGPKLTLDAQARSLVSNDEMVLTLAVERDGPQVGPLNEAVLAELNSAIALAKEVPGLRPRLGSVFTHPMHSRDGKPIGWRVRGEVVLESSQMEALAQLGGRLGERMQLANVQFRLSSERRRAEERRLLGDAARAFQARAGEAANAFGFKSFEMQELSLRAAEEPRPRPMTMMRAEAQSAPLPAEGGDSEVVVVVTGTVELKP
jgi:predicted secreted protein